MANTGSDASQGSQTKPGTKSLPTWPPAITAVLRCGDNDNDATKTAEYSVAAVGGGQVYWGDVGGDLSCDNVLVRLELVSSGARQGIWLKAGSGNQLHDSVTTPLPTITEAWVYVHVTDVATRWVKVDGCTYNGTGSSAAVEHGDPPPRGPHIKGTDAAIFTGQSLTDVVIDVHISMRGASPLTSNAIVAKIFLYEADPGPLGGPKVDPRDASIPDVLGA
jgi:hypothetical protein